MGDIFPIGSATGGVPFEVVSWGDETTPAAVVAERDVVDGNAVGSAGIWPSVVARRLGLPPVDRGRPLGWCGYFVRYRLVASGNHIPSQWGGWPRPHRPGRKA